MESDCHMDCPECGYALSSFDKDCPRCKAFKAKGIPTQLPVRTRPPAPEPPPVVYEPPAPRPLRNITPEPIAPAPGAEVAPLVIYTNRVVRWQPWAALAACVILCIAGLLIWQGQVATANKKIVDAARQGACERMPGFDTDRAVTACTQLAGALTYTLKKQASDRAEVIFYLSGVSGSLDVLLNQDNDGEWHAVTAKEGDEGARREYDQTAVPVWEHRDTPPSGTIGGPTVDTGAVGPPGSPPPAETSVPAATSPDPANSGSPVPAYTMRTRAGGGPPPLPLEGAPQ